MARKKIQTCVSIPSELYEIGKKMEVNFSELLEREILLRTGALSPEFNRKEYEFGDGNVTIYFVTDEAETYVKIGITKNGMNIRLPSIQIGNPDKLKIWGRVKGTYRTEKLLHIFFMDYKIRGEFYLLHPYLKSCIEEILLFYGGVL